MADHSDRKTQRKTHLLPTTPLRQNPGPGGSASSPAQSTESRVEQEEAGRRRRQGTPGRHNLTKRRPNIHLETLFPSSIREDGRTGIITPISQLPQSDTRSTESQMNPVRLFIASLGNPPPYSSTRHSAGHILLKALQTHLSLPNFTKSKPHGNGLTSLGAEVGRPEYTLWQSPSLMNVSGTALLKAYKTHTAAHDPSDAVCGLVILYDEMETSPAQLKLRRGATSAKGHNGVKSVQQSLQSAGLLDKLGNRFVKIGVGIGRPVGGSRSSEDVSRYVLGQLTADEKQGIDAKVPSLVDLLELEIARMGT